VHENYRRKTFRGCPSTFLLKRWPMAWTIGFTEIFTLITMIIGTVLYVRMAKVLGRRRLRWGLIGAGVSYLVGIPFSLLGSWIYGVAEKLRSPQAAAVLYVVSPPLLVALVATVVWLLGTRLLIRPVKNRSQQSTEGDAADRAP